MVESFTESNWWNCSYRTKLKAGVASPLLSFLTLNFAYKENHSFFSVLPPLYTLTQLFSSLILVSITSSSSIPPLITTTMSIPRKAAKVVLILLVLIIFPIIHFARTTVHAIWFRRYRAPVPPSSNSPCTHLPRSGGGHCPYPS